MDCYTIDNYTMKCYNNVDNNVDEEYGYFCDIEGDKTYYINNNEHVQYYPIPQKNNYKIIVQSLPTIRENDEKDVEIGDALTSQKHNENSNIYTNIDKSLVIIIRLLFYLVCCIMILT